MPLSNRWLVPFARACMVWSALAAGATRGAQAQPKPDPSPFAPGDLKRPIFDTKTPIYDTADKQDRSAGTIVAEVDGRPVTLGDVQDAIAELPPSLKNLPFAELFPGILRKLVIQQALVVRAQHQGLDGRGSGGAPSGEGVGGPPHRQCPA